MNCHDAKLYPGEYFIERRWKSDGHWEPIYRDNDGDVMQLRYDYIVAGLKPGEGVRFFSPTCALIGEVVLDKVEVPCEVQV